MNRHLDQNGVEPFEARVVGVRQRQPIPLP